MDVSYGAPRAAHTVELGDGVSLELLVVSTEVARLRFVRPATGEELDVPAGFSAQTKDGGALRPLGRHFFITNYNSYILSHGTRVMVLDRALTMTMHTC